MRGAVCLEVLRRLRSLGAELGLVYSVDGQPSTALYESVGFRTIDRHVQYRRPRWRGSGKTSTSRKRSQTTSVSSVIGSGR